jgi:ligand-binding sensor domain-containing protein/signal transduction histidine kinase
MLKKKLAIFSLFITYQWNYFIFLFIVITVNLSLHAQPKYLQFDNLNNELSTNIVNYIYQDKRGWMWFSTSQGLNRFDGLKMKVFKSNPDDDKSYVGNLVRFVYEDSKGNLWIGTEIGGLNRFNRETETFTCFYEYNGNNKIFYSANSIAESKKGELWIGTNNGLKKFDNASGKFYTYTHQDNDPNSISDNYVRKILFDKHGQLWIGSVQGLDCFNPETKKIDHINLFQDKNVDRTIQEIYEDNDGKIWIGTYSSGVFIVDPLNKSFKYFPLALKNEFGLCVKTILQDKSGDYWIGTRGGLYIYSDKTGDISFFEHDEKNPLSLIHNSILSFCIDNNDNIWVGTRGGISYLINGKQIFRHYYAYPNDNNYLNNSDVYAFWCDAGNNIWVGTDNGGINIFNSKTQTFRYITAKKQANSLSNNSIKSFVDDKKGNLWIGTYLGGIDVYNFKTGNFINYQHNPNDTGSLIDNRVWSIFLDSRGSIWVGTGEGVDRFDSKTKKFIHYQKLFSSTKQVDWIAEDSEYNLWVGTNPDIIIYNLQSNTVKKFSVQARSRDFCEDRNNRIWLATQTKGIILIDKYTGTIKKFYDESNGIANNSTFSIIEDDQGALWIGTAYGLSRFLPDEGKFRNFFREDGTHITHYHYGARYKLPSGKLLFGGLNGYILFDPKNIKDNVLLPPVVLTDFKIGNNSVPIGGKDSPLQKHISETKNIVLNHKQNFISFEFVALNFSSPEKNRYAYKLEGNDKDWNYVGNKREATYTNLAPGKYKFTVIASNQEKQWDYNKGTSVYIQIKAPFYKTWFFKIVLLIFTCVLVLLFLYLRIENVKNRNIELEFLVNEKTFDLQHLAKELSESQDEVLAQKEEIEKQNEALINLSERIYKQNEELEVYAGGLENKVKERTAELEVAKNKAEESDKLKTAILANMSHEIRTPLNSIVGLSNLLVLHDNTPEDKKYFTLNIKKNCDSLLHLITEILDLSIIETGRLPLNYTVVNISKLLQEIHEIFELDKQWLEKSHIEFKLNIPDTEIMTTTDRVRVEQILKNFLHNAFKYTEKGSIELGCNNTQDNIIFYVKDTGIGIPSDKLNLIFDRFVKLHDDANKSVRGVGLGLTICSKLTHMMGGKIWVSSELNEGSTFYLSLPKI